LVGFLELDAGAVVGDDLDGRRCVFLAALYQAEREIAEKLKALAVGRPTWPAIDVNKAIPWVEQRAKLALADSQKAALRVALVSNVMVITGGPGVGKTTLVNSLLKILTAKAVSIAFCAPTGRAARRLSESTTRRRPSIACSKPTPGPAASGATKSSLWTAISWWLTRHRWSMCR
jgi:exodeoxyribonuclease V alpha subunit